MYSYVYDTDQHENFSLIVSLPLCLLQQVDTSLLGFSPQEAWKCPYVASMGVYVFKKDVLFKLLRWRYPTSNDFGSEIIPAAIMEHDVQVRNLK